MWQLYIALQFEKSIMINDMRTGPHKNVYLLFYILGFLKVRFYTFGSTEVHLLKLDDIKISSIDLSASMYSDIKISPLKSGLTFSSRKFKFFNKKMRV